MSSDRWSEPQSWVLCRRSSASADARTVEAGDATDRADDDVHVSVREEAHEHCDGLGVSERRVIDHLDAFLPTVRWDLDEVETKRAL